MCRRMEYVMEFSSFITECNPKLYVNVEYILEIVVKHITLTFPVNINNTRNEYNNKCH